MWAVVRIEYRVDFFSPTTTSSLTKRTREKKVALSLSLSRQKLFFAGTHRRQKLGVADLLMEVQDKKDASHRVGVNEGLESRHHCPDRPDKDGGRPESESEV